MVTRFVRGRFYKPAWPSTLLMEVLAVNYVGTESYKLKVRWWNNPTGGKEYLVWDRPHKVTVKLEHLDRYEETGLVYKR